MASTQMIQKRVRRAAKAVVHPLLLAFVPALFLGGLWFGLQGALAVGAVAIPIVVLSAKSYGPYRHHQRDSVTGLSMLDSFMDDIAADLMRTNRSGRPTCVMMLDVDDFNQLVSRKGSRAANHVLYTLARRFERVMRDSDSLARLEGGKLGVLAARARMMDTNIALELAHRLQHEAALPIDWEDGKLHCSVSVGLTLDNQLDKATPRRLIEAAEMAHMEAARQGGGALRLYSSDMRRCVNARHDLTADLRVAFDDGQIEPWYQPQLCTDTGRITGFETLARWTHPERGVIPPDEFLEAVENAGLMSKLGETMLFHGLAALRAWDKAGVAVDTVGVNVSGMELRDPKLVERIRWELDRFDILPERFCLEVLETVVADSDHDVIARNIAGLAKMGCRIDLDDFGAGHASITNIRRFAISRLKIDRSFVIGIERDEDQRKLVSAILTMAEQLGLDALAEGVETPQAHAVLGQLGCKYVQGFGIARPMPFEDTIPWIQAHLKSIDVVLPMGRRPTPS